MYSADNDNVDDDDAVCRRWMKLIGEDVEEEEEEPMNFKTFDRLDHFTVEINQLQRLSLSRKTKE